ncbi:MAG: 3',5'-cyclic-nucleotide phosphodiesterase [Reyranella sp.]|uniref:MBL fold metallo-hydrolase n=1 Tax=Reyranella sp. TaxID=1929291 RepID=UPI001AC16875|nr:3',5'-cyclic-nucleotide phosphodiesterase [Reyranella sp.]MBN9087529.1 3',5'-cyclic-nucleotide phosphodiesterase [Reyranella sp.]
MTARTFLAAALAVGLSIAGPARAADGFDVVALGALGGIQDGNLSAWLIHPHDDTRAVTFDAGTLVNGLRAAEEKGTLDSLKVPTDTPLSRAGYVLTDRIKGYLVSHAHLDHVAGLVIASPDDGKKPIYVLPSVGAALAETYFNWTAWPNFTDRGKAPQLKKYPIVELAPGAALPLQDTKMTVTAFPLAHGGVESTAFLVECDGDAILYFGDTGPDPVEKTTKMHEVWKAVADKARQRKLKAILIESSYTSDRPDAQLFGHLTPKWIMQSLHELDALAGGNSVLKDLPVVITHIKYALTREQPQAKMRDELTAANDLGVRFLIPQQGMRWHFR